MIAPDESIAVKVPIVVPAGALLLTIRLLIVIVISLSALATMRSSNDQDCRLMGQRQSWF